MTVAVTSQKQVSPHSVLFQLHLAKPDFCLFGFLLESAEGLGIHSYNPQTGAMEVLVSRDMQAEFRNFLCALGKAED